MEPHVRLKVITTLIFLKPLFEVSHHKAVATARLTREGGPWVHLFGPSKIPFRLVVDQFVQSGSGTPSLLCGDLIWQINSQHLREI